MKFCLTEQYGLVIKLAGLGSFGPEIRLCDFRQVT